MEVPGRPLRRPIREPSPPELFDEFCCWNNLVGILSTDSIRTPWRTGPRRLARWYCLPDSSVQMVDLWENDVVHKTGSCKHLGPHGREPPHDKRRFICSGRK